MDTERPTGEHGGPCQLVLIIVGAQALLLGVITGVGWLLARAVGLA